MDPRIVEKIVGLKDRSRGLQGANFDDISGSYDDSELVDGNVTDEQKEVFFGSLCPSSNAPTKKPPEEIKLELFKYQQQGLHWMIQREKSDNPRGGILGMFLQLKFLRAY
jgi:hypothetical protein